MANQNANIHEIPLQTQELCLNKFDADIVNYTGFNKNNSVFYGDVLSPFYKKITKAWLPILHWLFMMSL